MRPIKAQVGLSKFQFDIILRRSFQIFVRGDGWNTITPQFRGGSTGKQWPGRSPLEPQKDRI
jgi:hypothetical protein